MVYQDKQSPFRPGLFPVDGLFVGRKEETQNFLQQISKVKDGAPSGFVISGERSSGKSSFANYVLNKTDGINGYSIKLHHVSVDLVDIQGKNEPNINKFFKSTIKELAEYTNKNASLKSQFKNLFAKLGKINKVGVFDFQLSWDSKDEEQAALKTIFENLIEKFASIQLDNKMPIDGLALVLDNIDGIAKDQVFARYLKGLMETLARKKVPLSLVICTLPEAWENIRKGEESTPRVYFPITLDPLADDVVRDFFKKAFGKLDLKTNEKALELMVRCANGQPYFMHEIGDAVFWRFVNDSDDTTPPYISIDHAQRGITISLCQIAQKRLNSQTLDTIQSQQYNKILREADFAGRKNLSIKKQDIREITKQLGISEYTLKNFITKMIDIGVLKKTEERGKYMFTSVFLQLYLRAYAQFGSF